MISCRIVVARPYYAGIPPVLLEHGVEAHTQFAVQCEERIGDNEAKSAVRTEKREAEVGEMEIEIFD